MRMNKLTVPLALLTVITGCAPTGTTPKSGGVVMVDPMGGAPVQPDASSNRTPTTAPVGGRVVEIITRPVLVKRAATSRPTPADPTQGSIVTNQTLPTPKLTLNDLKRIDTSVSTAPLMRLLTMKLNNIPYQQFAGFGALDFTPVLPEGTNPDAMTNDVLSREPAGISGAIGRLINGEIDLAILPRVPTQQELAFATKGGTPLRSDLVATDALVFTVNTQNPLTSLPRAKLAEIFKGNVSVWKDLGADTISPTHAVADKPITVAYRARGTGSEELLEHLLLDEQRPPELPVSKALLNSRLVLDASSEDPETLGFSVFCYAINMQRDPRIRVLAVDQVLPEPARVASGEYPLTTPIFVVTRVNLPSDSNLYQLRAWLGSMAGQKVLAEAGYMPISSEAWTAVRLMSQKTSPQK